MAGRLGVQLICVGLGFICWYDSETVLGIEHAILGRSKAGASAKFEAWMNGQQIAVAKLGSVVSVTK